MCQVSHVMCLMSCVTCQMTTHLTMQCAKCLFQMDNHMKRSSRARVPITGQCVLLIKYKSSILNLRHRSAKATLMLKHNWL